MNDKDTFLRIEILDNCVADEVQDFDGTIQFKNIYQYTQAPGISDWCEKKLHTDLDTVRYLKIKTKHLSPKILDSVENFAKKCIDEEAAEYNQYQEILKKIADKSLLLKMTCDTAAKNPENIVLKKKALALMQEIYEDFEEFRYN